MQSSFRYALVMTLFAGLAYAQDNRIENQADVATSESTDDVGQATSDPTASSQEDAKRRDRIKRCLDYYYMQPESVLQRSPWGVMHALIAFGVDTQVTYGEQRVNAIGWLCWNRPCRGQQLLYLDGDRVMGYRGIGLQGHEGQFLSMLAQSRVKSTYQLKVEDREFTVQDLVKSEMLGCRAGTELTFKLIGLSHYLDSDAKWKNDLDEDWDIPRLIKEELDQSVIGAACGGTHRMIGLAYAVHRRKKAGKPIDGHWKRAEKYVADYHDYIFQLQNPNGSFSTDWFQGRADSGDTYRYVQTTGHILEFMVFSLPEEQLKDPRVVRAVDFLTEVLVQNRELEWEIGPLGHALHALVMYEQRVFGVKPGERRTAIARTPE